MSTGAWLGLLAALPKVLELFLLIGRAIDGAQQRGVGRDQAVKEALEIQIKAASAAKAVSDAAEKKHASDPTDTAFDNDFKVG